MISGILNINKEAGYTSHDVVAKLRKILDQKKIGHTGTLDPMATGVLPVCLGRGTKVCSFLTDETKTYRTVMLLGLESDTQDAGGQILAEHDTAGLSEEEVRLAILSFEGLHNQIPPMYSAIKINGKKLYEYARQGVEIERESRAVMIYEIRILSMELPRVSFEVTCAKGTYIRTLCHDIGQKLGVGAVMESLVRTRVGQFELADALTLSQVETAFADGTLTVTAPDTLFSHYPAVTVDPAFHKLLYNGCLLEGKIRGLIRVYDAAGEFVGIYKGDGKHYRPETIFMDLQKMQVPRTKTK